MIEMEQSIIKLIDDVHEIEDVIALRIKEQTFSEIIMPSTPIEEMIKEIKEDPETKDKYLEMGEGKDKMIVPLCLFTTPRFHLGLDNIDPKKDMKTQIINEASEGICGAWDSQLITLADAAIQATDNVVIRDKVPMSRESFVDLFNVLDGAEVKAEFVLMYKDILELMKSWTTVSLKPDDGSVPPKDILGRRMVVTAKTKLQDKVYAFGASHFLGHSFMGAPELKIMIHKGGITWEVRVLTARNIGNVNAIAKSCVKN